MKIFDEKGVTLYELLATMTILAIVLPVIYGVFQTGLSLYNKIQIEGQLRDDADYAVSMMMNAFNSIPFDYVEIDGNNQVSLFDSEQTVFEETEKENSSFYTFEKSAKNITNIRSIEFVEETKNSKTNTSVSINDQVIESMGDFTGSSIQLACSEYSNNSTSECLHGLISVTFIIDHARLNKPLTLESQFGF